MTAQILIAIILVTIALTAVFYAAHATGTLLMRTAIAGIGFLVLTITLYLIASPI